MSNTIFFVTTNARKAETYSARLGKVGWKLKTIKLELPESRDFDVATVTHKKLLEAAKLVKERPLMVEDRGLVIRSLNGFPGSHVKVATELMGLPTLMNIIDDKDAAVRFEYAVGLMEEDDSIKIFEGFETGRLITRPKDVVHSLYDIFCSDAVPTVPLSLLSNEQNRIYEQYWTKTDALTKLIYYIGKTNE